jgi:glycosyltransferase involved in cell wall biosynthesis
MRILHILPSAAPSAYTRELELLLAGDLHSADICSLDSWRHWLDPRPLWALADRIRAFQPDLIHAYGLSALRAARLASRQMAVIVSHPLRAGCSSRLDRWCLRNVAAIFVTGISEALCCCRAGLPAANLRVLAPGVALPPALPAHHGAPTIVCIGNLRPDKGFYDAVWAFDILHFAQRELELVLVGDGPERQRLETFAQRIGLSHRIHFRGRMSSAAAALAEALIVWIPSRTDTGVGVALEAMAAGRAVIAARWPGLAEVIRDSETGVLVEPGDKMALARQTQLLLQDPDRRQRLGAAGRSHVEQYFRPDRFAQAWHDHCGGIAA